MLLEPFQNAVVLTGPTACGKTALGIDLAEHLGAEIISMDSMAVYRHMDIGTAKPSPADRQRIPHHLIDVRETWESASVAWWLEQAKACCREIEARGKRVLFVGGTPLYLKALLKGLFAGPGANQEIRHALQQEAHTLGSAALHARLTKVDPVSAARLHPNDLRRIIRALEVWQSTNRPLSDWQQQWQNRADGQPTQVVWLDLPRPELYRRIEVRVDRMIADGFVDEARALRGLPFPLGREAAHALGYREIFAFLDAEQSLPQAIERIKTRTRNFAKRQLTWFRNMPECRPCRPCRPCHPTGAHGSELTFTIHDLTIS
jgi:tRNA dimethylallyltransferase